MTKRNLKDFYWLKLPVLYHFCFTVIFSALVITYIFNKLSKSIELKENLKVAEPVEVPAPLRQAQGAY